MKPLDELIEQVGSYEALIELLYAICALTECGLDIDEMVERLDQIHSEYGIYQRCPASAYEVTSWAPWRITLQLFKPKVAKYAFRKLKQKKIKGACIT